MFVAVRAEVYASGFVLLWGWLAVAVRPFDAELGGPLPPWLTPFGAAVRSPAIALLAAAGLGCAHAFVLLYEEPALARAFGAAPDSRPAIPRPPTPPGRRQPRWRDELDVEHVRVYEVIR
ncbi:MAG TPA: hypothetical protein VGA37_01690 [Gemmatimonadales bacterium]